MNSPLVIYDADIPGLISPVVYPVSPPLRGGVPLSLIIKQLLELWIDPWVNMSPGDYIGVLVNGSTTPALGKTIRSGEENKQFTLELNEAFLVNGPNEVKLQVTRSGSSARETSAGLRFLFNNPRPGGEFPGAGPNTNLRMTLPPDVIANGVDAIRAAQGVDVTLSYLFMRAQDVISLDLDSKIKLHTVTNDEATAGSVVIRLFTADFWHDNAQFALKFRVADQLGNTSGPLAIWSPVTTIDVHVKKPALDLIKPKVLEAKDSGGTVLNFERDFYSAQHATAEVKYTGSAPGQTAKVYVKGRATTYGSEIKTVTVAGETLRFLIPRHEVIDCIGSKAEVTYTVKIPGDQTTYPSRDLDLTVTGQKHRLPEPTLNANRTNLRIYYPTLEAPYTGRISLLVGTTRYDSDEFPITRSSYTDVVVPPNWFSGNQGKTGLFNYTLRRTGSNDPIIFSWLLRLTL